MGFLARIVSNSRNSVAETPSPMAAPAPISVSRAQPVNSPGGEGTSNGPGFSEVAVNTAKPPRSGKHDDRGPELPGPDRKQDSPARSRPPIKGYAEGSNVSGVQAEKRRSTVSRPQENNGRINHPSPAKPQHQPHQAVPADVHKPKVTSVVSQYDSTTTPIAHKPVAKPDKLLPVFESEPRKSSAFEGNFDNQESAGDLVVGSKSSTDTERLQKGREHGARHQHSERNHDMASKNTGAEPDPGLAEPGFAPVAGPQPELQVEKVEIDSISTVDPKPTFEPEPQGVLSRPDQPQQAQTAHTVESKRDTRETRVHIGQVNVVVRAAETPGQKSLRPERSAVPGSGILLRGI